MTETVDVLVRAADAGSTYLSWRWLDDVGKPEYEVLTVSRTTSALAQLDAALASPREGVRATDSTRSAITAGAFADVDRERDLARSLTEAVLPAKLRAGIRERVDAGLRVRVRWTPSPRLARIPFELLCVDGDVRLLEVAESVLELPSAVHADRPLLPQPWEQVRHRPIMLVIDPGLPRNAARHELRSALAASDAERFNKRVLEHVTAGRTVAGESSSGVQKKLSRAALSLALTTPRSRLFYFGHVTSSDAEPGSAAIHLNDTARIWGMAEPLRSVGADGIARDNDDDHRPFTALDLLLGTSSADETVGKFYGHGGRKLGYELWPMPPRVALIACEGGVDYRSAETFGLVVAMVAAGAGLVTTTRWTLPTDSAFREVSGPDIWPTGELALRVDAAHDCDDPIGELARWQRDQLFRWRESGDLAYTPLVWASLTHTIAPARHSADSPDSERQSAPTVRSEVLGTSEGTS
ncbi:CHAT domain-containing protein [Nocardia salmonicida]|uniref:CHAT domain-containing protein n=1 Tax=Nocardia salmonicida TaxID=53431 RepID=UPI00340772E5